MEPRERLWTTQEIINVLAALHSAHNTLPWPFKFLLRDWHKALGRIGAYIVYQCAIESWEVNIERIWTHQEILGILTMLYGRAGKIGRLALSAAYHALYGTTQEVELEQLDPEVWGDIKCQR